MEISGKEEEIDRSKEQKQPRRRTKFEKQEELEKRLTGGIRESGPTNKRTHQQDNPESALERQLGEEQVKRELRERQNWWNNRYRPDAEVAGNNSLSRLEEVIPNEDWEECSLQTQEDSQDGTERRPIRLLEDSSEEEEDSEDDDEASFQRWWND
jgi:hypothetical protein